MSANGRCGESNGRVVGEKSCPFCGRVHSWRSSAVNCCASFMLQIHKENVAILKKLEAEHGSVRASVIKLLFKDLIKRFKMLWYFCSLPSREKQPDVKEHYVSSSEQGE